MKLSRIKSHRVKKAYVNYGIPSRELSYALLESIGVERIKGRRLIKEKCLRTSLTWGEIWTSMFIKLIGFPTQFYPPKFFFKIHYNIIKLTKIIDKEMILKAARGNSLVV